ncbi:hypothetical protein RB213_012020 [Colletotrichum asianum]
MPPRKQYAFMWTCCNCGQAGMTVVVDPCPNCHYPRCSRCRVDRVRIRQRRYPCHHNNEAHHHRDDDTAETSDSGASEVNLVATED